MCPCTARVNYSLDRSLSRVSKGPRPNNCHGPRLALIRHCMTNSSGPRTEPWGTPQEDVCQEDRSVIHLTRKGRDDRYDLNQLRTEPWMPNQDERRVIKMSWSIVSTAAERSSRQRRDTFCDPIALTR